MEEKFREKKLEIWVYLARLSSFLEIFKNAAVPFANGNCRKFKPDVLVEGKTS